MGNNKSYNNVDKYSKYIKVFNSLFIKNDDAGNDINNEEEYIESELFEIYEKKFMEEFLTTAFQLGVNAMRNSNFINESNVKNEQVVTKIDFMDYQQNKCKGLNKEDKCYKKCSNCILNDKKPVINMKKVDNIWTYNNIEVDFINFTAKVNGEYVKLGMMPIKILKLLLEYEGQVLSRSQILDNIWGNDISLCDRTIDVHISNLKRTLMLDTCIQSIRYIGYKINL
ncbi:winged helix-turn-helix domain-containing protein [Clostridium sp.]|uniref:winged helix-turn-helix domain-containing protein n=1 Tax=Clostridium sp. TaxID=1506 RepID=UPI00352078B2